MPKKLIQYLVVVVLIFLPLFSLLGLSPISASTNPNVYNGSLDNGWNSWSWGSDVKIQSNNISFTPYSWGALYLHTDEAIDLTQYQSLNFSLQSTGGSPKFKVLFYDSNDQPSLTQLNLENFGGAVSTSWTDYSIPTSSIPLTSIKGFAIQDSTGQNQQTVYVKDIFFKSNTPSPTPSSTLSNTTSVSTNTSVTYPVFSSTLSSDWVNWSWDSSTMFLDKIVFTPQTASAGLYLHKSSNLDTSPYQYLHLEIQATSTDEKFWIAAYDGKNNLLSNFVNLEDSGSSLTKDTWLKYNIPLSALNASNKLVSGFAIQGSTDKTQSSLFIKNIFFSSAANSTIASSSTSLPSPTTAPTITPAAQLMSNGGYITSNDQIYKNGSKINLYGINWFGAETGTYVAHGLWARNYKEMITQIKSLGFNAVRVPICPATLSGVTPNSIDYSKNPDLQGLNSLQVLDKILNELNNQGLYILLDHHRPDCQAISELWYTSSYPESQWISDLKFMATRYQNLTNFIGIDLKNEPHGSATWGTGNSGTDWNKAAERAGQAILSVNPNILVFLEGVGENPTCSSNLGHFWGENLEGFNCSPIANIPSNKFVLSPHIYGPDVSYQNYFSDSTFPANMPQVWDTQFGNLLSKGVTIVPGEWGGKYGTNGGLQSDVALQNTLASYLKSKGICNSFYWSLNPNSGDTGGILQDDWNSVWTSKVNLVKSSQCS